MFVIGNYQGMDEVPFFSGDLGDTKARDPEGLHVLKDSARFGEPLKLLQGDQFWELAAKFNVDHTPLRFLASRLCIVVGVLRVECSL